MLIDILSTLYHLKVFDRSNGKFSCLLLDNHGSCFALNFIAHVANKAHAYCVFIEVPYITSLWQAGDSSD